MFVLVRDGVPIYAGRQIEWVVTSLLNRLKDCGYSDDVIDNRDMIIESHEPLAVLVHHPDIQESWRIYGVLADS